MHDASNLSAGRDFPFWGEIVFSACVVASQTIYHIKLEVCHIQCTEQYLTGFEIKRNIAVAVNDRSLFLVIILFPFVWLKPWMTWELCDVLCLVTRNGQVCLVFDQRFPARVRCIKLAVDQCVAEATRLVGAVSECLYARNLPRIAEASMPYLGICIETCSGDVQAAVQTPRDLYVETVYSPNTADQLPFLIAKRPHSCWESWS